MQKIDARLGRDRDSLNRRQAFGKTMSGKLAKKIIDKVKLSQLKALITVAQTGSFSEAALQINVSQSTVSHSIAAMEEALGVVLIHRGRQKATLTPVGDRICHQAKQVLSLIDDMGREAECARGIEGGQVRIAAFRSLASEVLPEVIAQLHQRYPTVQILISEFDNSREVITSVREGKADLAIADLIQEDDFDTFAIMEDPFIGLLPPSDISTALTTPLTWNDLRQQPLIVSSGDCCRVVRSLLKQCTPPIEIAYLIANDSTAVSMTRQGLGLSIMPKLAAQPIPHEVRTAQLPFNKARPLGVSWLKATWLTPAAYALLDVFKERFKNEDPQRYGVEHEKATISATGHH
jgi:DNA-binding transcriptional LysR family regulator